MAGVREKKESVVSRLEGVRVGLEKRKRGGNTTYTTYCTILYKRTFHVLAIRS